METNHYVHTLATVSPKEEPRYILNEAQGLQNWFDLENRNNNNKLKLSCHPVAAVLTPVQTKQISVNIHKQNNTKTQYKQYKKH
jgi:hypothetical protein